MEIYYWKIIETAIVLLLFFMVRRLSFRWINSTQEEKVLQNSRGALIKRAVNFTTTALGLIFIFIIWGVKQADIAVFIGSVMTVVGIAFFAQWSLLSNITSSLIIFFNHPVKIGDSIALMEGKDYTIEGTVDQIGLFFVRIETSDGDIVSLPNNVFIQKNIKRINNN